MRGGNQNDTNGAGTSYTDTKVTAGTTYTYTLQSFDAAGRISVESGQASATVPAAGDTQDPTPPTNLQATGSTGKVDLTWTAGTDDTGVTGYKVFRGGTQIDTIGAVTSYTDTNVTAGTTYTYTLQSLDAAGHNSVQSGQASATVPSAGGGGSQLTFTPTDDATIIQASPTTNSGGATTLQTDGSPIKDFLMKFNVSGIGTSAVSSASLRMFVADSSAAGGVVRPTTSSVWSQGSVTWNTAPPAASSPTATIGAVNTGTWITADVTSFVTGDGAVSLRVSSTNSNGADYVSREGAAANVPQLIVSTSGGAAGDTQEPTPPTNLQATGSTGKVDLTWTAGTDDTGVTGYKVFRGGTQIDTIGAVTGYKDAKGAGRGREKNTRDAPEVEGKKTRQRRH